jgi:hypothetical protein
MGQSLMMMLMMVKILVKIILVVMISPELWMFEAISIHVL